MPVSSFRCTPAGRPSARAASATPASALVRVDGRRQPALERLLLRAGRELGQDQDRRLDPALAQPEPLLDERDPEPRRAGLERRPRDLGVAVPVPVGLDDRHQLGPGGPEQPDVVRDRVEVDLGDRGTVPRHPPTTSRIAVRDAFEHVGGRRCPTPRSSPGEVARRAPWTNAAAEPRIERRAAPREQRGDHPGEHVARAAGREERTAGRVDPDRPSGAATSVRLPFSSTVAEVRAASSRT